LTSAEINEVETILYRINAWNSRC